MSESEDEEEEEERKCKRVDKRYYHWCPIMNCPAKPPQKKLPNHFDRYHKNVSKEERTVYTKMAKKVPRIEKRPIFKRLRGQQTLEALFMAQKEKEKVEEEEEEEEEEEKDMVDSTLSFPSYPVNEDPSHISFQAYLTSIAGRSKSEAQAEQTAKDVSKLMRFACKNDPIPKWEWLLEKDMLLAYIEKLERHSVGADGQTQKLDAIDAAVRYYRQEKLQDDPGNVVYGKAL